MEEICLVIDDSRLIRRGLKLTLLREGLFDTVLEAADGSEALELLARRKADGGTVDLVLCDLDMPEVDGFAFLDRFKRDPDNFDVPVIVLTGRETVEHKVRALESGASDYLTKPFAPAELVARVKVHRNIKALQDELREANRQLQELAIHDPLTGAYNRRYCMDVLHRELERSRRQGRSLSLVIADLDHFKRVNDTFGHDAGDRVLVAVARLLSDGVRLSDTVARYGGEEFVLLLPETTLEPTLALCQRLRGRLRRQEMEPRGVSPVTLSMGVASFPEDGDDADALLKAADEALYAAKTQGRDRVVAWRVTAQRAAARGAAPVPGGTDEPAG